MTIYQEILNILKDLKGEDSDIENLSKGLDALNTTLGGIENQLILQNQKLDKILAAVTSPPPVQGVVFLGSPISQ